MSLLDLPSAAIIPHHEPTTDLRDWLRVVTVGGDLVFPDVGIYAGGLPSSVTMPAIVITRVGNGVTEPVDEGLFQFDVWGSTAAERDSARDRLVQVLVSAPPGRLSSGEVAVDFTTLPVGPLPLNAAPGYPWSGSPADWSIVDVGGEHRARYTGGGEISSIRLALPTCPNHRRSLRLSGYQPSRPASGQLVDAGLSKTIVTNHGPNWPADATVTNTTGPDGVVDLQPFAANGLQEYEWVLAPNGDVTLIQIADGVEYELGTFSSTFGDDTMGLLASGDYTFFAVWCHHGIVRFCGATIVSDVVQADPNPDLQHRIVTAQVVTVFSPPS